MCLGVPEKWLGEKEICEMDEKKTESGGKGKQSFQQQNRRT